MCKLHGAPIDSATLCAAASTILRVVLYHYAAASRALAWMISRIFSNCCTLSCSEKTIFLPACPQKERGRVPWGGTDDGGTSRRLSGGLVLLRCRG